MRVIANFDYINCRIGAMSLPDIDQYIHYFMTYEEKVEFVQTLWDIAQEFVDQALNLNPPSASDNTQDHAVRIIGGQ